MTLSRTLLGLTTIIAICSTPLAANEIFLVRMPATAASGVAHGPFESQWPARVVATDVSGKLTVAILMDGMSPERWERVKAGMSALASSRSEAFRLLAVTNGAFQFVEWTTPRDLTSQLGKLNPAVAAAGTETHPLYRIASLNIETEPWESLLLLFAPETITPLTDPYLHALTSHEFRSRRLRLFIWPVSEEFGIRTSVEQPASVIQRIPLWDELTASTCGAVLASQDAPALWTDRLDPLGCREVYLDGPALAQGFFPYTARLTLGATTVPQLSGIFLGPSVRPVSVDRYQELVRLTEAARAAYSAREAGAFQAALESALGINPMHVPALRLGAEAYGGQNDWNTALRLLTSVSVVSGRDPALFRELGNYAFELKDWSLSETHYTRTLELGGMDRQILDRMSQIREQSGDLEGATRYLGQEIDLDPRNIELHIRQGRLFDRLNRLQDAGTSYEAALKLDSQRDDIRLRLLEINKESRSGNRVAELLNERVLSPTKDLSLQMKYAAIAEESSLPDLALKFYALAIQTDPKSEPAHFGRSRLLFETGNLTESYDAVMSALSVAPDSLRLRLIQIDILERQDRIYSLKDAVQTARELGPQDGGVLSRAAQVTELFGSRPAEAYAKWTEASEAGASVELRSQLEQGIMIALRDGETALAQEMAARLDRVGGSRIPQMLSAAARSGAEATVLIPGGMRGLAIAANLSGGVSPGRFMTEYARALLRQNNIDAQIRTEFQQRLTEYFALIKALYAQTGSSTGDVEIVLDVSTSQGMRGTERILDILGWQIRRRGSEIIVEVRTGADSATRQTFVSLLGIEEAEMKLNLEAMKPYTVRIRAERVPVVLTEPFWLSLYSRNGKPERELVEEMLRTPALARLYVGLSSMNAATQAAVVEAVGSEELARRATRLSFYGASIAIEAGKLVLPGGEESRGAWEKLVQASPDMVGDFLRNLIRRDDGKLLAYYYNLAVLPVPHQRFFTRTVNRLSAFYKAFPFSDEATLERGMFIRRDDPFVRLTRELPLDDAGNVDFPGGSRAWMVARGESNIRAVDNLIGRAGRLATPDDEDELLLNMLDRTYEGPNGRKISQVDNFLAVVRISRHRTQPMDERMALSLAQSYATYHSAFPYFVTFTQLTGEQASTFFRAAERIEKFEGLELNTALGHFHGLLKLMTLLAEAGAIDDEKAARLFASICEEFAGVKSYQSISALSFGLFERVVGELGSRDGTVDELLIRHLAGPPAENDFVWNRSVQNVNVSAKQGQRIREVLRLQSISSLDALMDAYQAALSLMKAPDASAIARLETALPGLIELTPAREERLPDKVVEQVIIGRPGELTKLLTKLKKEMAEKKISPRDVAEVAEDLIVEMGPFLKTSLTGWIYAYYFSPDDLAISNNKYLVRSHQFFESITKDFWPETRQEQWEIGGRLIGGFAQMAFGVAVVATAKVEAEDSLSISPGVVAQLAAVRSVPWHKVSERAIHIAALKVRLGREFLAQAALNETMKKELASATVGVLGVSRRLDLLSLIEAFDLPRAAALLSASDLFFLADSYVKVSAETQSVTPLLQIYTEQSRKVPSEQLRYLGGYHAAINGCVHPHLVHPGPYEDFANMFSADALGERLSDILLAVAESADRAGLPSSVVALVAEKAVHRFSHATRSSPVQDWVSAVDAMRIIDLAEFVPLLLEKP